MQKVAKGGGDDPATVHYTVVGNGSANTKLGDTANSFNRPIPRFIFVVNAGNIEMLDDSNTWITYAVTAGQRLDFRAQQFGANTTANVICWA